MNKTRLYLSLKRWSDLVLYSFLAVLIYKIFLPLLSGVETLEIAGTLAALFVTGYYFCSILSFQKMKQVNESWQLAIWHPPTFFAVGLVFLWKPLPIFDDFFTWFGLYEIALPAKTDLTGRAGSELAILISMVAIIAAVVLKVVSKLSCRKPGHVNGFKASAADIEDLSANQIIEWINEEKPLGESLFFGRQMYVNRIYNLIISNKSEGKRIALVGGFGNGKSSVIKALQNELHKNQGDAYIFVSIDCWGRDPETIEQQILSMVIDKLGEITDVTAYKHIPENFQRALQDQGGWLSSISHLVSSGVHDAQAMLSRVDRLLTLLNKRLLLIIEDPDRGGQDQVRIRTDRIASLMDRLGFGTTPNIGFIFCLSPNGNVTGDHLIRVCEYREDLDDLADEFIPLLNKICSKIWENQTGTIYPNDPIVFEKSDLQFDSIREFKSTIRTVDYLWRKTETHNGPLHGEIDLYELVLLSLAKEYHQSLFTNLESLLSDRNKDHYKWCTHQKNGRVKRYTDDLINKRESVNQWLLIDQLLTPKRQYQVCASNGRTDYLQRFLRRGLMAGEKSDQDILRGLNELISSIDGYQTDAEDDRELVQNLICCGSLSPWYYEQLDKLNNPRLAYIRTAQKIIQTIDQDQPNDWAGEHPATEHLWKIVQQLKKHENGVTDSLWVLKQALYSPCEAGLNLLNEGSDNPFNDLSSGERWQYYKIALKNPCVSTSKSLWENPSWLTKENVSGDTLVIACIKDVLKCRVQADDEDIIAIEDLISLYKSKVEVCPNAGRWMESVRAIRVLNG